VLRYISVDDIKAVIGFERIRRGRWSTEHRLCAKVSEHSPDAGYPAPLRLRNEERCMLQYTCRMNEVHSVITHQTKWQEVADPGHLMCTAIPPLAYLATSRHDRFRLRCTDSKHKKQARADVFPGFPSAASYIRSGSAVMIGDVLVAAAAIVATLVLLIRGRKSRRALPPGPRPLPLIGNLLDMPKTQAWLTYRAWTQQYGDIVYVEALGQSVVILGSAAAVNDLFEQRSAIYSDRPVTPMVELYVIVSITDAANGLTRAASQHEGRLGDRPTTLR
jgi:hypothetical protein